MYQIQDLDVSGAVEALARTSYPLLVLEPGHNLTDDPYDTAGIVSALRETPDGERRVLLAYVDVGQAEDYRDYWASDWVAPTAAQRGIPDFLVTVDPDGWSGNYPVAYWRSEWKQLWLGSNGVVATLARLGFDGVYLDWVEAYDDDAVRDAAFQEGVDPELEMIRFIEEIGAAGRAVSSGFLVVPQNAPFLIDAAPDRYAAAIDALAVEDTWFHGEGDADWDDPDAGDLHDRHDGEWSTPNRLAKYREYMNRGLAVFSVDYCISQTNADQVYRDARQAGLRPLVTRVSLSRLTETPPPTP
jgi:cysteinyl-tRNA synthetase